MAWVTCHLTDDFEISDAGAVRRVVRVLPRGRQVPYELSIHIGTGGYRQVAISVDQRPTRQSLHRLVLFAFRGPPPSIAHQAAHLDGDKANNRLGNLAWVLPDENAAHKRMHGTAFVPRKLLASDVIEMRALYAAGDVSYRTLAKAFGVSVPTACGVVTGKYWPHLPNAIASFSKGRKKTVNGKTRNIDDY